MRLGLGNTLALTNNGSSNPDALSLNLDFATDKSFSKPTTVAAGETVINARKGPSPVFFRASGGTMVGSDGLIQYSPENLLKYSQEFNNSSGWDQGPFASATANVIASPTGSIDADRINAANVQYGGVLRAATGNTPTYAVSTAYTMSVYAKAGTASTIGFRLTDGSMKSGETTRCTYFSLAGSGTATLVTATNGTNNSASCTDVGNGWYRCVLTHTTGTSLPLAYTDITITDSTGNIYYIPVGTENVYLWGAQVERSSTARQYIPTTTAVVYGPRFDHEPVGRTNWLANSSTPTLWNSNNGQPIVDSTTTVDPFGSLVPNWKLAATSSEAFEFSSSVTVAAGTYVFSVCAKRVNSDYIRIVFFQTSAAAATKQNVWFNLNTGAKGTVEAAGGGLTAVAQNITSLGDGWYRCSVSCTTTATDFVGSAVISSTADGSTSRGSNMVYGLAAVQLESGSVPTDFITTTNNAPLTVRICKGLLIEESSANFATYSQLLTNVSWVPAATTASAVGIGPNAATAFEVAETSADSGHNIINTGGLTTTPVASYVAGLSYTFSIFAKKSAGSVDWIQLTASFVPFGSAQYANFNIGTGVVGNFVGTPAGFPPKIESVGNGWYRCSLTLVATTTATANAIAVLFTNNTDTTTRAPSYFGNTANKVFLTMAQAEQKASPTSYIPTTSGTASRSADLCSITGSAFTGFYNQSEGTWSIAFTADGSISTTELLVDYNSIGIPVIYKANGVIKSGLNQVFEISNSIPLVLKSLFSSAYSYKSGDHGLSVNGSNVTTSTNASSPALPLSINFGYRGAVAINSSIKSIKYYKKRLTNAKLQSLTT